MQRVCVAGERAFVRDQTGGDVPTIANRYVELLETEMRRLRAQRERYPESGTKQDEVMLHFMDRADQIASAAVLCAELATPLQILSRVLCEDLFLVYWIADSEENAVKYEEGVLSELAKGMRANIRAGRANLRNIRTKEPVTEEFINNELLPRLSAMTNPRANIEQLAGEKGLSRVYDILYRAASLEVHGNTFGIVAAAQNGEGCDIALPAILALLECIIAIVHYPRRTVSVSEILTILRLQNLVGK